MAKGSGRGAAFDESSQKVIFFLIVLNVFTIICVANSVFYFSVVVPVEEEEMLISPGR